MRDKDHLIKIIQKNKLPSFRLFGSMRGTEAVLGDIVSPDPELWDCELGIAFRDENGVPRGYDGKEVDLVEAVKNVR